MNSTEAIISAVEAGLGIGFVPVMALDKAKLTDSIKIVPLENGPIRRQLSFALLGGPVREGPLQDLIGLLRLVSPSAKNKTESGSEGDWKVDMSVLVFTTLLFGTSLLAGLLGALTGLGGGVVIVPALVLLFKVDLRYAIGASLISVIATSSGAAAAYVSEGLSNIRIGMFLEIATTLGALLGAYLTARISNHSIAVVFGVVLLYSAYASFRGRFKDLLMTNRNPLAVKLKLCGTYSLSSKPERYCARRVPLGFGMMFGAGTLSGSAWDRVRCGQGFGYGSGDGPSLQDIDYNEQLHDRGDGCCECRDLSRQGIH